MQKKFVLIAVILMAMNIKYSVIDYFVLLYLVIFLCIRYSSRNKAGSRLQVICTKGSVSLYLCHSYYARYLLSIERVDCLSNVGRMVVYILLSIITAGIVSILSALIRTKKQSTV